MHASLEEEHASEHEDGATITGQQGRMHRFRHPEVLVTNKCAAARRTDEMASRYPIIGVDQHLGRVRLEDLVDCPMGALDPKPVGDGSAA